MSMKYEHQGAKCFGVQLEVVTQFKDLLKKCQKCPVIMRERQAKPLLKRFLIELQLSTFCTCIAECLITFMTFQVSVLHSHMKRLHYSSKTLPFVLHRQPLTYCQRSQYSSNAGSESSLIFLSLSYYHTIS